MGCCSELAREKMWSRIHLIPVLQAEEDRDLVRRALASQAMEKELLGAQTKVYNSDRWVIRRWSMVRECADTGYGLDSCGRHMLSFRPMLQSRAYCEVWGRTEVYILPRRYGARKDDKCSKRTFKVSRAEIATPFRCSSECLGMPLECVAKRVNDSVDFHEQAERPW